MNLFIKFLIGFAILIVLLIGIAYLLPNNVTVSRSTIIKAEPDKIFLEISDWKKWQQWSHWKDMDPEMKQTYSSNTTGIGAYTQWESKHNGKGQITFTDIKPNQSIQYQVQSIQNQSFTLTGTIVLEKTDAGTRITWTDSGELGNDPRMRYYGLFIDGMMGPYFEKGFEKLKQITEK